MKRYGILLLVIAIALGSAPAAMAKCQRCKPAILGCGEAATGWLNCEWTWDNQCFTSEACPALQGAAPGEDQLADKFEVASVERTDGRQPASAEETRVASLATSTPDTH